MLLEKSDLTSSGNRHGTVWAVLLAIMCAFALDQALAAPACGTPGADGPGAPTGIVNSYYPGNGLASAGSTSIPVTGIDTSSGGASTAIAAGDLLLVIQMQDASISSSNSAAYGGSGNGQGYTFLGSSGRYEYVTAAGPVSGGALALASPLLNSYTNGSANSIQCNPPSI